jgi:hypothetical protein
MKKSLPIQLYKVFFNRCFVARSAKNIEVSALISCIASICHVYMKFPLKIKDSTFFLIKI